MHELSITAELVNSLDRQSQSDGFERVRRINLLLGDMAGIDAECVKFCFNQLSMGTMAQGALLSFESLKSKFQCRQCGEIYERSCFDFLCPRCGGKGVPTEIYNSLYIESIEVE